MGLLIDKETAAGFFKSAARSAGMDSQEPIPEIQGNPAPPDASMPDTPNQIVSPAAPSGPPIQEATGTEEELAMQLLTNINDMLANETDQVVKSVSESDNIPRTIGEMVSEAIIAESTAMEAAGHQPPTSTFMDVARHAVNEFFDLAVAAGAYDATDETQVEADQRKAMLYATSHWSGRMEQSGRATPEMQQGIAELGAGIMTNPMTADEFNSLEDM